MNIEQLQNLPDAEKAKLFAARHALTFVEPDMKIGIGTGSTAVWFLKLLAHAHAHGLEFRACATSSQTTNLAEMLEIKIESLNVLTPPSKIDSFEFLKVLDLVIDGTDEFDDNHNLIKGGGGALLQEKIVAYSAKRFIVITDSSKEVSTLGKFPLPVEVVKFSWQTTRMHIEEILNNFKSEDKVRGSEIKLRMNGNGEPFETDEKHYILDLHLKFIRDSNDLRQELRMIPGVVETGFFLKMANEVVMADCTGLVKSRETGGDWVETRYELAELADMLPKD